MAQWQNLLRLDSALQGRVSQLYEGRLPRQIRHSLCVSIESQNWGLAAVDENKAKSCFYTLLANLEEEWNHSVQANNILQGPDFAGMREYLLKHFEDEPRNLAVILYECLREEKKILASVSEGQGGSSPVTEEKWTKLDNEVSKLKSQALEVKMEIKSLGVLNEKLDFIQSTWQVQVEKHTGLAQSQAVVEQECLKKANFITQTKQMVLQQLANILKLAEQIVPTLTDVELPEWKRRQQLACIGSPADTSLYHLQKWFTDVAEVLIQVLEQLLKLQDQNQKYSSTDASNLSGVIQEMEKMALSWLTKLLSNALVVEKQPIMSSLPQRPLILKTGVRFTMTVRFLANLPEFKLRLNVKPVFDKDVAEAKTIKGFRQFDLNKDDCKVLDADTPSGDLVAEFGLMSLREKRCKAKGTCESRLSVTEELHIITFVTELQYAKLRCNIEATSLPVIVVSSSNQIPSAWASVMWFNMLSASEPRNLSFFVDPPPIPWQELAQVLSWQFLSVGRRELDENQLSTLRDKIVSDPDDLVHWSKFSKSESPWIWIDGILDLIKKHLIDIWQDGSIMGFVSRERTRVLLQEKQTGTFLLRFSESNKEGAITFSWVEHSNGEVHVHAVEPYTKQELSAISLPYILYHYTLTAVGGKPRNPLHYLYPDIPKDTAFGRYSKTSGQPPAKKVDGYVVRKLVPTSVYPTPPPSPPSNPEVMDVDMDMDMDWSEYHQLLRELYSDLHDLLGLDNMNSEQLCPSQ